jgi:hypothetical protein
MNTNLLLNRLPRARWLGIPAICIGLGLGLLLFPVFPQPDRLTAPASVLQTAATPTPLYNPTATPPTQGGHGKDIFFVYCMPCHGDQGQGLTDEFRNRQYPPEDVNCWKSGCHGDRPYENGFKLPKTVPVLIGAGALQRFDTAQNLYDFIRRAMPFNKPGSLNDEQYLQLSVFLLESNQMMPEGARVDPAALQKIAVRRTVGVTAPSPASGQTQALATDNSALLVVGVVLLIVASVLVLIARSRRA